jgi:hypothetical protein
MTSSFYAGVTTKDAVVRIAGDAYDPTRIGFDEDAASVGADPTEGGTLLAHEDLPSSMCSEEGR